MRASEGGGIRYPDPRSIDSKVRHQGSGGRVNLKCAKCQAEILVPAEELRQPEPRAECPQCHARYRLKPKTGAPPSSTATADVALRSTPSFALPSSSLSGAAATRPPASADDGAATVVSTGGVTGGRSRVGGPVFLSGELVAGRYRIARFLAKGGMGEVYQAEDVELRQQVALKTVSAHIGDETSAIERFKREIALARQVTHPNVCRIFDLGQHLLPALPDGTPLPAITFLTMELLHGETLSQRLRREGRLSTDVALPIVEQMAAALEAAHRARIVHRDFKSENVFLVPGEDGGRAVVTDFGVARGAESSDHFAAQVTGLGIVGTPAYMAPEQVENKEITAAADIYALGIVVYEMVTGKLPFESPNPLTTAVKRLKEAPPPPHVHVPDLAPHWERAILRALERRPEDRFATVGEMVEALRGGRVPSRPRAATPAHPAPPAAALAMPRPTPAKTPRRLGRPTLLGLLLLAVALVSAGLFWLNRERELAARQKMRMRPSVAVLQLKNLSGLPEADWMSTALAEMLTTELARGDSLRTLPGQRVVDARRQLQLAETAELDREQLSRLRGLLACDFVIAGSYLSVPSGDQLRVDLRLQDAAAGTLLEGLAEEGRTGDMLSVVGRLGQGLRTALGLADAGDDPLAGQPREPEAARLYAEALDALRDAQPAKARDLLRLAADLEPGNSLLHSALASSWQGMGYGQQAADSARRAFELSSALPLEDRLLVEARLREVEGRWPEARDLYRKLADDFPDNLEYGLALVAAERATGAADAALRVIDGLRRLPPPLADDPRLDLAEADAAAQGGQFQRQLAAAQRAAAKAQAQGATLALARARLAESQSQRLLGQPEAAARAAQEALELFQSLDQPQGQALAATALGNTALDLGRFDEATAACEQAAALYRRIGDQGGLAAALNNLAVIRKRQGNLNAAEGLYAEAETIYRETGDRRGLLTTVNNRGVVLVDRDRLAEAERLFAGSREGWEAVGGKVGAAYSLNNSAEVAHLQSRLGESETLHRQALATRRTAGIKPDLATTLTNLAGVLLERGEPREAEPLLEEAEALATEIGDRSLQATVLTQVGELRLARGEVGKAGEALERALELRRALAELSRIPPTQVALARVAFAEGVLDDTVQLSEEAQRAGDREGRPAEEARAAAWRMRALIALGQDELAATVADEVATIAATSEQPVVRLLFRLAQAELLARRDLRTALGQIDAMAREAEAFGQLPLSLEAELAWAALAANAGQATEAGQRRAQVRAKAQAKGLEHLASRAGH
jgi:serine/threonine protein kinase/tetratricopeptide (TPR) repeat protein/DNA-directed RNA polymerase subunit RPC12/RpoP